MAKKTDEKDVLIVRDEKTGEISVVAGLNADGSPKRTPAKAENAQAVVSVWENAKKKERGEQTALERVLDVPLSLPALMRGQKIVRREAGAKGQTLDGAAILARVAELAGQTGGDRAAQEARLGEMLECLCAAAEAQGLDAETALRGQTKKRVERLRAEDEKTL